MSTRSVKVTQSFSGPSSIEQQKGIRRTTVLNTDLQYIIGGLVIYNTVAIGALENRDSLAECLVWRHGSQFLSCRCGWLLFWTSRQESGGKDKGYGG